jgi:hypothetical protein
MKKLKGDIINITLEKDSWFSINGWEIIDVDKLGPDEVFVHLKDSIGGEYKGIITGVMD